MGVDFMNTKKNSTGNASIKINLNETKDSLYVSVKNKLENGNKK